MAGHERLDVQDAADNLAPAASTLRRRNQCGEEVALRDDGRPLTAGEAIGQAMFGPRRQRITRPWRTA
jgi:hypothetical protein